jgi:alginate O-acetyltransferase complex protein AlgI
MQSLFDYSFKNPWFFTNYAFILVLGFFLLAYACLMNRQLFRKIFVIAFSLFFYYKSSGPFLLIFILLIFGDFHFAKAIDYVKNKAVKKLLLMISILISLSFLLYFKYSGFFLLNLNQIFHTNYQITELFLPIGISFYTFQSISYIVDVYQKKITISRNFVDYCFYMTFFPHLVAGPIVRAVDFIPQINQPKTVDLELLKTAIFRIMLGLSKKLFIADFLSRYVDMVHVQPSGYSGLENILCMYAYSFQIYFDFSGYSDIAIGIALLMGYALKENFMNPYHATNITDFWRRWHISLSTWLRDYIYIPLGGNRKGVFNTYVFLMITMLVGGIWHGASWNFIVWGAAHGLALVVHKTLSNKGGQKHESKNGRLKRFLGIIFTFHLVSFLWIFFRAVDFKHAFESINQMMTPIKTSDFIGFYFARPEVVGMLILSAFLVFVSTRLKQIASKTFNKAPLLMIALGLLILFQLILQIKNNEIAPFIYFQF